MSLSRFSAKSPPIREALALNLRKGLDSALVIVHAERVAVGVAEVKLLQVALKMGFRNVMVRAVDAALQKSEVRLNGVRVNAARTRVLARAVVRGFVRREL